MVAERTRIHRLLVPCRKSKLSTQSMHILCIKYYLFQLEKMHQEYIICINDFIHKYLEKSDIIYNNF